MDEILQIARRGGPATPQTLRRLVEDLQHDDALVRTVSIETLERLTGQTMGYRPYDPPARRDEAVARWARALESGSLPAMAGSDVDG